MIGADKPGDCRIFSPSESLRSGGQTTRRPNGGGGGGEAMGVEAGVGVGTGVEEDVGGEGGITTQRNG
jgi:hypothetical protein